MSTDDKKKPAEQDGAEQDGAKQDPASTSWADVIAASQEAEVARPAKPPARRAIRQAAAVGNAETCIAAGDIVRHPKFGDCSVHHVSEKPRFVHMAKPNEKVRKLSLDIVEFTFIGIEGRRRVFTTQIKK